MNDLCKSILSSLNYSTDAKIWFQGRGERFIKNLGVLKGQSILDFGCRIGHYVIPTAVVVGSAGRVYALDKDHSSIEFLLENAKKLNLARNIIPIKTAGELDIPLDDASIDGILLYDIIHIILGIDRTLTPLQSLLTEFYRVLKPGGLLSVSVDHLSEIKYSKQEILNEFRKSFFFRNTVKAKIMHWDWLREGQVDNFIK
ncbi:MAG: class I SAM-dependent methyltransferase [Candidatus Thorarchaeota archaeon]